MLMTPAPIPEGAVGHPAVTRGACTILAKEKGILWSAVVEAASALGLSQMLPRLVASRLPREPYLRILSTSIEQDRAKVLAQHRCPHECKLEPDQCLTALLAEAEVQQTAGRPFVVQGAVALRYGMILLDLEPVDMVPSPRRWDELATL